MEFVPSQSQAHLIVASIRVLSHMKGRPPTSSWIAEQLDLGQEQILHILRGLERNGIVKGIENPFDVRFDLLDHLKIETLPKEPAGPDMGREIENFQKEIEDRQKRIEQMMRESDPETKSRKKTAAIEEEFRKFQAKKGKPPFGK